MGWRSINRFTKTSIKLDWNSTQFCITSLWFNHSAYNWEKIKFHLQDMHNNASLNSLAQGLFHKSIYSYPQLWKSKKGGNVRGHSPLKDPTWYFLLLCADSQGLYSLSVPGTQEGAELHAVLRTEVMRKSICWDSLQWLPSVTFYLKVIYSVMTLFLRIWNAFWPFQDCYLLGFVYLQCFYCLKLPCIKIYKHAFLQIKHLCFTRDLGPLLPSSRRLHSSGPGLQRPWQLCLQFPQIRVTLL